MSGHRPWQELRNPALDEPGQRQPRDELRRMNDLVQQVAQLRAQAASSANAPNGAHKAPLVRSLSLPTTEAFAALCEGITALGGQIEISAVFGDERIALLPTENAGEPVAREQS